MTNAARTLLLPLHLSVGACSLCILHASLALSTHSPSHHLAPFVQLDLDYESYKISWQLHFDLSLIW